MKEENQYIIAIKKLDEIEDENVLYSIANHFRSKADFTKYSRQLLEEIEKEQH